MKIWRMGLVKGLGNPYNKTVYARRDGPQIMRITERKDILWQSSR